MALALPDSYYAELTESYAAKRALMLDAMAAARFHFAPPDGAYYVIADITPFGFPDDVALARHLVVEHGLAAVPGSSFYPPGDRPQQRIRFSFPKRPETLRAAGERLRNFARARGVL